MMDRWIQSCPSLCEDAEDLKVLSTMRFVQQGLIQSPFPFCSHLLTQWLTETYVRVNRWGTESRIIKSAWRNY